MYAEQVDWETQPQTVIASDLDLITDGDEVNPNIEIEAPPDDTFLEYSGNVVPRNLLILLHIYLDV